MIIRFRYFGIIVFIIGSLAGCEKKEKLNEIPKPMDPWAFRSVLDKQPLMLTLALDSVFYVAYDLSRSTLYKVWKGEVLLEDAAYTDKKNVQPTSWGKAYYFDSIQQAEWIAEFDGRNELSKVVNKGYVFRNNQIYLKFDMILSSGDTIPIEERPEFIRDKNGRPGLERLFSTSNVPEDVIVSLRYRDTGVILKANGTTNWSTYFDPLSEQSPPNPEEAFHHMGRYWMDKSDCFTCHQISNQDVGPSFH